MHSCSAFVFFLGLIVPQPSGIGSASQLAPGAGNARAELIGSSSPLVQRTEVALAQSIAAIHNGELRRSAWEALHSRQGCVVHRARLSAKDKQAIIQQLIAEQLLDESAGQDIAGGLTAGVFPPVVADGTACPHAVLDFSGAPGSDFQSHHSFPGGLAVHEAFNQQNAKNLAVLYRQTYAVGLQDPIDEDVVASAPVWHDWAKILVFQWNADGTEFKEIKFGGQGKNDNFGKPGDSRTGAHHILGLAETIARGLPALLVITQASAHAAPTLGNEYKVVNWLRAAAILARIDPVAKGYLTKTTNGEFHLPDHRTEYQIDNLSDADFVNSVPAIALADSLLRQVAPLFGYDAAHTGEYNNRFRNVVLARLSAERIEMIYSQSGITGVKAEVEKLRQAAVI